MGDEEGDREREMVGLRLLFAHPCVYCPLQQYLREKGRAPGVNA